MFRNVLLYESLYLLLSHVADVERGSAFERKIETLFYDRDKTFVEIVLFLTHTAVVATFVKVLWTF